MGKFHQWMLSYKSKILKESCSPSIRRIFRDGQPGRVTNNDSENFNLILKQGQNFAQLFIQAAIPSMQTVIENLKKVCSTFLLLLPSLQPWVYYVQSHFTPV